MEREDFICRETEVGIVFPLYCFGAPKMVIEFMKRLKTPFVDYMYVVCDGAGSVPGMFLDEAKRCMRHNTPDISGYYVQSVTNYLPFGDIPPSGKVDEILADERDVVSQAIGSIKLRELKTPKMNCALKAIGKSVGRFVKSGFERNVAKHAKKFRVDDNCVGCGACAKLCPARNIEITDCRPVWGNKCEACLGCLHWCPTRAIQLGNSAKKSRYHNPDVQVEELYF